MIYRTKPRWSASKLVWRTADMLLAAGGLYCLYLAVSGMIIGEVALFSRRLSGSITWVDEPLVFSGMVTAWASGGIFLLRLTIAGWRHE